MVQWPTLSTSTHGHLDFVWLIWAIYFHFIKSFWHHKMMQKLIFKNTEGMRRLTFQTLKGGFGLFWRTERERDWALFQPNLWTLIWPEKKRIWVFLLSQPLIIMTINSSLFSSSALQILIYWHSNSLFLSVFLSLSLTIVKQVNLAPWRGLSS